MTKQSSQSPAAFADEKQARPPAPFRANFSPRMALLLAILACFAASLTFCPYLGAYMTSKYLGGFPGMCEGNQCYDDGAPISDPPSHVARNILQHQLTSPGCPTDYVWISLEYPSQTGSDALDSRLAKSMDNTFKGYKKKAENLACNDFEGCQGLCLPVGYEIKQYVHQSGSGYLSVFRVERFTGNFRQNRQIRGTVAYKFENYALQTGTLLRLKDIFINPNAAVPLFWAKIEELIAPNKACALKSLKVNGRNISAKRLEPNDMILTREGATVALTGQAPGPCPSQAVDLSAKEMIEIGAYPALWAWD